MSAREPFDDRTEQFVTDDNPGVDTHGVVRSGEQWQDADPPAPRRGGRRATLFGFLVVFAVVGGLVLGYLLVRSGPSWNAVWATPSGSYGVDASSGTTSANPTLEQRMASRTPSPTAASGYVAPDPLRPSSAPERQRPTTSPTPRDPERTTTTRAPSPTKNSPTPPPDPSPTGTAPQSFPVGPE